MSVMASASYSYACLRRRGVDIAGDITARGSLFNALLRTAGIGVSGILTSSTASVSSVASSSGPRWSYATVSGRWMSAQAGEGTVAAPAKTVLRELLAEGPPRTAGELWVEAEKRGMKSKRFMKMMLKQMRERGEVQARPPGVEQRTGVHGHVNFLFSSVGSVAGGRSG